MTLYVLSINTSLISNSDSNENEKRKGPRASPPHALCNFLLLFFLAQTKTCRCSSRVTVWLKGVTASRCPTLARMEAVRSPFFIVWILEGQNPPPWTADFLSVASATIAAVRWWTSYCHRGSPTVAQPLQGNVCHHCFQRSSFSFRKPEESIKRVEVACGFSEHVKHRPTKFSIFIRQWCSTVKWRIH